MIRGSRAPVTNPKTPRVVEISRWVHELGMIEDIERLGAKLHLHAFCYLRIFQQGHVSELHPSSREGPPCRLVHFKKIYFCFTAIADILVLLKKDEGNADKPLGMVTPTTVPVQCHNELETIKEGM